MRKLIVLLLAASALTACGATPKTASRDGLAPGCWTGPTGMVHCPQATQPAPPPPTQRTAYAQILQARSGTYYVDVAIADVCCFKMMLDTGASDVSVPVTLWYAMVKDGVITEQDHFAVANYRTANGVVEGLRFRMPPMTVAGVTVHNVIGSVTKNNTGKTILLGQSFLQKFKAWQINNATGQLILAY
jgi:clan AA aspartic protease (TIGR02281 family)